VQDSGLAALAVSLARQADSPDDTKGAAAVAAQLRLLLADVRLQAADLPQKDGIDDLRARRASRAASG
jgi:hypothetical protein